MRAHNASLSLTHSPSLPPSRTHSTHSTAHPPTHPPTQHPTNNPPPSPPNTLSFRHSLFLSLSLSSARTHSPLARTVYFCHLIILLIGFAQPCYFFSLHFVISSYSSSVLLNPLYFFFLGLFIFKLFSYIRHLISLHQVYSTLHWGGSCPVHVSGSWERGRERAGRGGEGEKLQDQER